MECPGPRVLAVLIVSCLASPLGAQTIAPADSARPETIERLLVAADAERQHTQAIENGVAARMRANPAMAAYADLIQAFLQRYASFEAVKPDLLQLYRQFFSESEVEELIRFHQSDFGRRFMPRLDALALRSGEMSAERIRAHASEVTAAILARATASPP
jgi:hypothetical protein